ncbi:MAG: hypothetical protein ACOCPR_04900 [Guyparkeria sp.]
MNKRFARNLLIDAGLWVVIVGGYYLDWPHLSALAPFLFVGLGLLGIIAGIGMHVDEIARKTDPNAGMSKPHRSYATWSSIAETLAIAAAGAYLVAAIYGIASLLTASGRVNVDRVLANKAGDATEEHA